MENELVPSSHPSPSEQLDGSAEQGRCSQMMSELEDVRDQKARTVSELNDMRSRKAQLVLELDDLNRKVDNTQYWKRLCRKTQKWRDSLKRRNKQLQAELVRLGQDEVSNTNLKLRRENDLLKEKLYIKEKLYSYQGTFQSKEPFTEDFQAQNVQKALEHVDVLLSKLHKVLQGQDILFSIEKLDNVKISDLTTLFKRGFGLQISIDDSARNTIPTTNFCRTKLRAVILSLVSAGLCKWVFEAEVGVLFQKNDLAYSKLRSLLATQGR